MAGSSWGTLIKFTNFGESHGSFIGGVLEGVPANFQLDFDQIQYELDRRKPGQSSIVTQRKESDTVSFISGIYEGKTLGTPIAFLIKNEDQKSSDYDENKSVFRPSHADFTYQQKYGIRDYRGGGRASARETATRVVAGAIAKQLLAHFNIEVHAFVDQVGSIKWEGSWTRELIAVRDANPVRVPSEKFAEEMESLIRDVRKDGDTIGGAIQCVVTGMPVGVGEPVFDKLHASLGKALFSIHAVKGVEFGSGFSAIEMRGSEHNDVFLPDGSTKTNHSGGIQCGISNGMPITCRVAFKPVATLMKPQQTIDEDFNQVTLKGKGRHDACVVPRAVPIVEAMVALTVLDYLLIQQSKDGFKTLQP